MTAPPRAFPRRFASSANLAVATVTVCALATLAAVMAVSHCLALVHTRGARRFCEVWTANLAARSAALQVPAALQPSADALRMQAEYFQHVLDSRGSIRRMSPLRRQLKQALTDLQLLAAGVDPLATRPGTFLRAYRSFIDGALQPYSLSVPKGYTPGKRWILLIYLHGHGWYAPFQGHPAPAFPGVLVVSPHGRGSTDYMRVGEVDVMRVIAQVQHLYSIDPNRIYLTGASMGGTGSWQLATHYPDVFAGIGPCAGNTDHHVWEAQWGWSTRTDGGFAALKRYVADTISPITYAENLLNVPAFAIHGELDDVVPVQHSRHMVERLRAIGARVAYVEAPGAGHADIPWDLRLKQLAWLGGRTRNQRPKRVRFKTASRRYSRAYWTRLVAPIRECEFSSIDARVAGANEFAVDTRNVLAFGIQSAAAPVDDAAKCAVAIDGSPLLPCTPDRSGIAWFSFDESMRQWKPGLADVGRKTAAVEGPVGHVFETPFVIVYGTTSPDPLERRIIKEEAERFVDQWEKRYGKPCQIQADVDLSPREARLLSLVLYGGPWANTWTARLADQLPVRVTQEAITLAGERQAGETVGVKLCYPSPLNAQRYVALFAATTWRGMWQINSRFGNWFDWGAYDCYDWYDFAVFDERTWSPETFRAFGFFDRDWRIDARTLWRGVASERARQPPFRTPPEPSAPSDDVVYLSDILPTAIDQDKYAVAFDSAFAGGRLTLGEQTYAKGLGVKAPSRVVFDMAGQFTRFSAEVGIDYAGREALSAARIASELIAFEVYGDGKLLASSDVLFIAQPQAHIEADITGVQELSLSVTCVDSARWLMGGAIWADAKVSRSSPPGSH